jgi:hypothetical protein
MKIRILSDMGEVYDPGTEMEASQLINDYIEAVDIDEAGHDCTKWLNSVSQKSALEFIHTMWGIDYEEC